MIRILHSVSNMDRAGIETMLMNYYRHIDRSKIQFDFLCNKKKPGAYDAEIKEMGGNIYHTPGLNPAKYPSYLKCMKKIFEENPEYKIVEAHNGALGVYALHAAKVNHIPVRIFHAHGASITRDWKLPIKLVCKALLPSNIRILGSPAYICVLQRKDRKSIAITPCAAEHPMSFKVPDRLLTDGQCRMMINGIQFIQALLEANGLAAGKDHQFKGRYDAEKNAVIISLKNGE